MGNITADPLKTLATALEKSACGQYLLRVLEDENA